MVTDIVKYHTLHIIMVSRIVKPFMIHSTISLSLWPGSCVMTERTEDSGCGASEIGTIRSDRRRS